ncbi:uncharacterized protein FOBCDRAFT_276807 [Fusarium oxysporum Fo47]|uniref:Uncharacterized protein n=1 Tax=Fusarium oxysporum Fo47 TaxID=660027 RepID=W9JE29_FUSOX|nr:uncharacterized protein FOBCDRAFT_276807 [Fusarium oxysporum Fo47]EWZ27955.1 hypothetical protein FOZG_18341 [Fusarium oxysporum Fo47]QKD57188.2 hypothetical protein FOBCDRAFT_276807 [Fusarium oxysporum Fo47]
MQSCKDGGNLAWRYWLIVHNEWTLPLRRRACQGRQCNLGRKRAADKDEKTNTKSKQEEKSEAKDGSDKPAKRPAKKAKPSLPDIQMRIVLTEFTRWTLDKGTLLDIEDFILKDKEAVKRHHMVLETSGRSSQCKQRQTACWCPHLLHKKNRNDPDNYKAIADANGAILNIDRARSGTTIRSTTAEEGDNAPPKPVYLLSSTRPGEKFCDMAYIASMEPRIVPSD